MGKYLTKANTYAKSIVSGKIVANEDVKMACSRYLIEKTDRWELDEALVEHVCLWFETVLKHVKGHMTGRPVILMPFQCLFLANMYGFVDKETHLIRRFQDITLFVGRKNSKSTLLAGIALYDMVYGEAGGEVYSVATKKEQAGYCQEIAMEMVERMPSAYKKMYSCKNFTIRHKSTRAAYINNSKFLALPSERKSLDGLNPSLIIVDEAAAIAHVGLYDVMESATGSRRSWSIVYITTASTLMGSPFFHRLVEARRNLHEDWYNERQFALLYALEEGDNWEDQSIWVKANPGMEESVTIDNLEAQVIRSKHNVDSRINFKVKQLNLWEKPSSSFIDLNEWRRGKTDRLKKMGPQYVSVDMARVRDLAVVCSMWCDGVHREFDYMGFYPRASLGNLPDTARAMFDDAIKAGKILLTEKPTVDQDAIYKYILGLEDVESIGLDKWETGYMKNKLEDEGYDVHYIEQNMRALSCYTKELEVRISNGEFVTVDDQFVDWQAGNAEVYRDSSDNIKIVKGVGEGNKIDIMIGAVMCLATIPHESPSTFTSGLITGVPNVQPLR